MTVILVKYLKYGFISSTDLLLGLHFYTIVAECLILQWPVYKALAILFGLFDTG